MNLKEQLRTIVKETKESENERRKEESKRKRKEELVYSSEEWNAIEEWIEKTLVEYANKIDFIEIHGIFRRKYIRIPWQHIVGKLFLPGENPCDRIEQAMKRFCKQHKLKLRYSMLPDSSLSKLPFGYGSYYLIGI